MRSLQSPGRQMTAGYCSMHIKVSKAYGLYKGMMGRAGLSIQSCERYFNLSTQTSGPRMSYNHDLEDSEDIYCLGEAPAFSLSTQTPRNASCNKHEGAYHNTLSEGPLGHSTPSLPTPLHPVKKHTLKSGHCNMMNLLSHAAPAALQLQGCPPLQRLQLPKLPLPANPQQASHPPSPVQSPLCPLCPPARLLRGQQRRSSQAHRRTFSHLVISIQVLIL